ncbi:2-phosphosulfolactate phosphatase [Brevibacillus sp. SYSU BS000544]|uniref:2-phosphosulfolactate phosphatase n=1 Tax=Brevibacillus sp. SYSU BS000544 TaxID=3416443 RepID=UPI003CE55E99
MRIEVVPTVEEIRQDHISNHTVVMIDVLRASSTILTALANGFEQVIPVETIGQAYTLRTSQTILAGERHCKKISDFDFNNSPTELAKGNHKGFQLVLTTTNGTRAIQKAERSAHLLIGSFLNATACMRVAAEKKLDITLYCAGSRQEFALEDGLAAGCMIHKLKTLLPNIQVCDLGEALEASYLYDADKLPQRLQQTTTGRRLVQHQFMADLAFCAQVDLFSIVPVVKERRILPHLVS